jgi:hypothetical protein
MEQLIMALTATLDLTVTPIRLTVVSDKRKVTAEVKTAGEIATCSGTFPVQFTQTGGRTWTLLSDDETTAVYTG